MSLRFERCGCQPNSSIALAAEATWATMSPERRGSTLTGTARPVT